MHAQLLDSSHSVLAVASVEAKGDRYEGIINLRTIAPSLRELFERYEEIVNNQSFSTLDQIEDEINELHLVARFGAEEFKVKDLQLFPEAGTVSFEIVAKPVSAV